MIHAPKYIFIKSASYLRQICAKIYILASLDTCLTRFSSFPYTPVYNVYSSVKSIQRCVSLLLMSRLLSATYIFASLDPYLTQLSSFPHILFPHVFKVIGFLHIIFLNRNHGSCWCSRRSWYTHYQKVTYPRRLYKTTLSQLVPKSMRAHPTLNCLKVEFLLKTDGGYPTNAAVFPRIDAPNAPKYRGGWLRQQGESVLQHGGGHALLRVFTQPQNKQTKKHTTNIWKYVLALRVSPHQPPYTHVFLRVDFLLKTDSGYPRDAEVTLFTLANPEHSLRFNTHWSAPQVPALAHSGGPRKMSQSPVSRNSLRVEFL